MHITNSWWQKSKLSWMNSTRLSFSVCCESSSAEHAFHRHRGWAHPQVDLRNFAEDWEWRLMNLPVTQRIVIKFCWDAWTQKKVNFTRWRWVLSAATHRGAPVVVSYALTLRSQLHYLFVNIQLLDVEMMSLISFLPIPAKLPALLGRLEVGWERVAYWTTKASISLKRVKIEGKLGLLWRAYRKSPTLFRFFGSPPYFYFRFRLYGRFCLNFVCSAQQSVLGGK